MRFLCLGSSCNLSINKSVHCTVENTRKDLEESGWAKTDQPTPGSVIIWEAIQDGKDNNEHIGFYVGRNKAVSNSSTKRKIAMHNWTYDNNREIIAIYSSPILSK
jgi:hypothetical protein